MMMNELHNIAVKSEIKKDMKELHEEIRELSIAMLKIMNKLHMVMTQLEAII